jgi:hypothetical protein
MGRSMGVLFPACCLAVAVAVGAFATTLGVLDRWDGAGAAAASAAALLAAIGTLRSALRGPRSGSAGSVSGFLARSAAWSAGAFVVLAPAGWLLGRAWVVVAWDDPHHSQAGLYALLVGLWYGAAWAPALGVWRARRARGAAG